MNALVILHHVEIAPRSQGAMLALAGSEQLAELTAAGLLTLTEETVDATPAALDILHGRRQARELTRTDRHPCACGAPLPRFEGVCGSCTARGHLHRSRAA